MKTKLFSSISTILATVALLASCGGNTPSSEPDTPSSEPEAEATVVNVSQAVGWDYESSTPVLEGQLVRIEDVCLTGHYSSTSISIGQFVEAGEDVVIDAMQVNLAEANETYDIKDIVTVEGTVTSTNGRPHLADATIEWGTAGQEVCEYDPDVEGTGSSLWYSGINAGMERSWFDGVSRADSSKWFEFDVQFVTVPEVTAGQETHYWVVFPGENPDLTDTENYCPIDVTIPALSEAQATVVNEWAAEFEAGDCFTIFAQVWFDSFAKLIQPYDSWRFNGTNGATTIAGLYNTWAEAVVDLNTVYSATMPTFTASSVFSWRVSHSVFETEGGYPAAVVTANVKNGEESFLELFPLVEGSNEVSKTTYESQGWYIDGLFEDSNSGDLFLDMYNGPVDGEHASSTATTLIEVVIGYSTLTIYVIALNDAGMAEGGSTPTDAAATIAAAINANFTAAGYSFGLEWDAEYEEWSIGLNFGPGTASDEATLSGLADIIESYLAGTGLTLLSEFYDDPTSADFEDVFGIGIATYVVTYVNSDRTVACQIITYAHPQGVLYGQMAVWML